MKNATPLFLVLLGGLFVILQTTWLRPWGWANTAAHLSLLLVIMVTVQSRLRLGLGLAIVLGFFYQLFSSLPAWIHPISFIVAAGAAWIVRHRFVTNRTSTSLLSSVVAGTAVYYAVVAILILLNSFFRGQGITPYWPVWLSAAAWQMLIHPMLAGFWWVVSRQRQISLRVRSL